MKNHTQENEVSFLKIVLPAIIFMIFFQLLTEFVEAIYLFGLLGTEIPTEIGLVILFFSPILLLFLKKPLTSPFGLKLLVSISLVSRAIEIFLPTRGRLIFSGIGFASMLLFFTAFLSNPKILQKSTTKVKEIGSGLSLAIFALVLTRAVNSGSDLTAIGMFRIVSWFIVAMGLVLVWRGEKFLGTSDDPELPSNSSHEKFKPTIFSGDRFKIYLSSFGIINIIAILYFAITSPNIISRWGGASNLVLQVLLIIAWLYISFWWLRRQTVSPKIILGSGLLFSLFLVLSILPHQVNFPPTMESGYPLAAPQVEAWQPLTGYLMVLFSPALLLAFVYYLGEFFSDKPSPGVTAGSFSISGGFLLILVLSQVFTTVYDYIPVIGPAFRDKYWLTLFLPSILSFAPILYKSKNPPVQTQLPLKTRRWWLISAAMLALISVIGLAWRGADPSPPMEEKTTLRVFTYNIQQGFDDQGERNFDGQLKLIREKSPDIIGLQECDTARIAGGNADVVAYMADHLDMYSYYGPSSVTGTFGIALLSRYPIENAATYFLYSKGEQVAVIEADITVGERVFRIYVTHLGNGGPIFQIQQMLELMQGQENLIAMGDFNFRPYEEQYAITPQEFLDAYIVAEQKTIPTLWGNVEPWEVEERIDHFFISKDLKVSYLEYLTQPESDHPAVFAEIGW